MLIPIITFLVTTFVPSSPLDVARDHTLLYLVQSLPAFSQLFVQPCDLILVLLLLSLPSLKYGFIDIMVVFHRPDSFVVILSLLDDGVFSFGVVSLF